MPVDLNLVPYYLTAVNNGKIYKLLIGSTTANRGGNVNFLGCTSILLTMESFQAASRHHSSLANVDTYGIGKLDG